MLHYLFKCIQYLTSLNDWVLFFVKEKKLLKKHFHKPENKQSSLRFYFIYNTNMAKSQLQKVLLKKINIS